MISKYMKKMYLTITEVEIESMLTVHLTLKKWQSSKNNNNDNAGVAVAKTNLLTLLEGI